VTEDNRRRNARTELERAEACLAESKALHASGMPYGATSCAHYATFHAARALLFTVGIEARSHRGVAGPVGEHFVKPGGISPEMGRLLARMQRDREDADCESGAVFTGAESAATIADAERFLAEARRIVGG